MIRKGIKDGTKLIDFKTLGDERGTLVALEEDSSVIPFEIKRVYYMWDTTPGMVRGKHAHYKLKQVLVCVSGSCDIVLDDGHERCSVHLDSPARGLFIDGFVWREMENFSQDAVLMVLASEHYEEADYIRDYDVFLRQCARCE